jgi:OsmC subfamily peroxiredoxin
MTAEPFRLGRNNECLVSKGHSHMAEKTAVAKWAGSLTEGSGSFSVESGVITDSAVSWASRTNEANGQTSPEELIAAAHASCYAMAFSYHLQIHWRSRRLSVSGRIPAVA